MKNSLLALVVASCAFAACAVDCRWPQLPDGTLPDVEVVTNVALHVDADRLQTFSLRLQADDGAAKEVLVAVGCDANADGDLSFDEAAFVFGCDCGARYLVDCATGEVLDGVSDTLSIARRDFNPAWNLAKVVRRGVGTAGEIVTETVENRRFVVRIR